MSIFMGKMSGKDRFTHDDIKVRVLWNINQFSKSDIISSKQANEYTNTIKRCNSKEDIISAAFDIWKRDDYDII